MSYVDAMLIAKDLASGAARVNALDMGGEPEHGNCKAISLASACVCIR